LTCVPFAFRCRDARLQSRLFVRREPKAEMQPQLQPALLRLSAIISQYFTRFDSVALYTAMTKVIGTSRSDAGKNHHCRDVSLQPSSCLKSR